MDEGVENFLYQLLYGDCSISNLHQIARKYQMDLNNVIEYIEKEDLLKGTEGNSLCDKAFLDKAEQEIGAKCQMIILELTGSCNLRCKYCIYHAKEKSFREFNQESMPKETIRKSVDFIRDHHGEDTVFISFYGGEPLLRFDLMKYAIEYAQEQITDQKIQFGFTTNLTLMTREIAQYLVQVPNLSIICSIDGPEEIHNASRVYQDGRGSYQDTIRGFEILKEELEKAEHHSVNINFNAVYMVPYDKEKLVRIDEMFQKLCSVTENSTYGITYPSIGTIPEELKEYETDDDSMWEWMKDSARKTDDLLTLKDKDIIDSLTQVHQRLLTEKASPGLPMNGCCVPGARRLYIDTKGDLYACERINKSPKLGNIFTGFDLEDICSKYFKEYSERSIKYCSECWAAKMCPSCYAGRMDEEGISKEAHAYCEEFKEHLRGEFSLYHEILEKSPEKLGTLNKVVIA